MTQRHCRACNGWHDLDEPWPLGCAKHFRGCRDKLSDYVSAPQVIRDALDDMRSMADGQMYTSKRTYYDSLKRKGCEIVEKPPETEGPNRPGLKMPRVGHDVKRAMEN